MVLKPFTLYFTTLKPEKKTVFKQQIQSTYIFKRFIFNNLFPYIKQKDVPLMSFFVKPREMTQFDTIFYWTQPALNALIIFQRDYKFKM